MSETPRTNNGYILVMYIDGEPEKHCLWGPAVTLGRRKENQIQVLHPAVSSCHLVFSESPGGGYQITDVGSSNGTMVNGVEINQCQLRDGDCIMIGNAVSAQFLAVSPHIRTAGDFDSLALVKGRAPTFEHLCDRENSPHEELLVLSS